MICVYLWKTTPNSNTYYSKYMSRSFGSFNLLKCVFLLKTLPLVSIDFLNVIIFPYGGYEINLLFHSRRKIIFTKCVMNYWSSVTWGIRREIFYNFSYSINNYKCGKIGIRERLFSGYYDNLSQSKHTFTYYCCTFLLYTIMIMKINVPD